MSEAKSNGDSAALVHGIVHTPGPWRVYCDEARGGPRCLIVDKDDGEIASVNPHRSAWNENAELIGAAPELLHACELLLMLSLPQDISGMAMVEVARRTVRKAKGLD